MKLTSTKISVAGEDSAVPSVNQWPLSKVLVSNEVHANLLKSNK